jgi:hypothetical protein
VANAHRSRWPSILRKFFSLSSQAESDSALHHLPIAPPRDVRRAARHTALRTLDHIGCGKAFVRRRWQLQPLHISPRQHFVCVEAVLGEVSEWIVSDSYGGTCPR